MTTANAAPAVNIAAASRPIGVKIAAALAGSLAVAAAAQVSVPLPGTTVPMTLQPLAVLVVGGLLGARFGALSLVAYLAMGAAGLPVFTPGGLPGAARLFGQTGGFLLAYPVAASVTGLIAARARGLAAGFLAPLAGLAIVFAGGLAQLTIITGDARAAVALGALPFLAKDLLSLVVAGALIRRFLPVTRALS
jgi:biotin transport system substrate-specific component